MESRVMQSSFDPSGYQLNRANESYQFQQNNRPIESGTRFDPHNTGTTPAYDDIMTFIDLEFAGLDGSTPMDEDARRINGIYSPSPAQSYQKVAGGGITYGMGGNNYNETTPQYGVTSNQFNQNEQQSLAIESPDTIKYFVSFNNGSQAPGSVDIYGNSLLQRNPDDIDGRQDLAYRPDQVLQIPDILDFRLDATRPDLFSHSPPKTQVTEPHPILIQQPVVFSPVKIVLPENVDNEEKSKPFKLSPLGQIKIFKNRSNNKLEIRKRAAKEKLLKQKSTVANIDEPVAITFQVSYAEPAPKDIRTRRKNLNILSKTFSKQPALAGNISTNLTEADVHNKPHASEFPRAVIRKTRRAPLMKTFVVNYDQPFRRTLPRGGIFTGSKLKKWHFKRKRLGVTRSVNVSQTGDVNNVPVVDPQAEVPEVRKIRFKPTVLFIDDINYELNLKASTKSASPLLTRARPIHSSARTEMAELNQDSAFDMKLEGEGTAAEDKSFKAKLSKFDLSWPSSTKSTDINPKTMTYVIDHKEKTPETSPIDKDQQILVKSSPALSFNIPKLSLKRKLPESKVLCTDLKDINSSQTATYTVTTDISDKPNVLNLSWMTPQHGVNKKGNVVSDVHINVERSEPDIDVRMEGTTYNVTSKHMPLEISQLLPILAQEAVTYNVAHELPQRSKQSEKKARKYDFRADLNKREALNAGVDLPHLQGMQQVSPVMNKKVKKVQHPQSVTYRVMHNPRSLNKGYKSSSGANISDGIEVKGLQLSSGTSSVRLPKVSSLKAKYNKSSPRKMWNFEPETTPVLADITLSLEEMDLPECSQLELKPGSSSVRMPHKISRKMKNERAERVKEWDIHMGSTLPPNLLSDYDMNTNIAASKPFNIHNNVDDTSMLIPQSVSYIVNHDPMENIKQPIVSANYTPSGFIDENVKPVAIPFWSRSKKSRKVPSRAAATSPHTVTYNINHGQPVLKRMWYSKLSRPRTRLPGVINKKSNKKMKVRYAMDLDEEVMRTKAAPQTATYKVTYELPSANKSDFATGELPSSNPQSEQWNLGKITAPQANAATFIVEYDSPSAHIPVSTYQPLPVTNLHWEPKNITNIPDMYDMGGDNIVQESPEVSKLMLTAGNSSVRLPKGNLLVNKREPILSGVTEYHAGQQDLYTPEITPGRLSDNESITYQISQEPFPNKIFRSEVIPQSPLDTYNLPTDIGFPSHDICVQPVDSIRQAEPGDQPISFTYEVIHDSLGRKQKEDSTQIKKTKIPKIKSDKVKHQQERTGITSESVSKTDKLTEPLTIIYEVHYDAQESKEKPYKSNLKKPKLELTPVKSGSLERVNIVVQKEGLPMSEMLKSSSSQPQSITYLVNYDQLPRSKKIIKMFKKPKTVRFKATKIQDSNEDLTESTTNVPESVTYLVSYEEPEDVEKKQTKEKRSSPTVQKKHGKIIEPQIEISKRIKRLPQSMTYEVNYEQPQRYKEWDAKIKKAKVTKKVKVSTDIKSRVYPMEISDSNLPHAIDLKNRSDVEPLVIPLGNRMGTIRGEPVTVTYIVEQPLPTLKQLVPKKKKKRDRTANLSTEITVDIPERKEIEIPPDFTDIYFESMRSIDADRKSVDDVIVALPEPLPEGEEEMGIVVSIKPRENIDQTMGGSSPEVDSDEFYFAADDLPDITDVSIISDVPTIDITSDTLPQVSANIKAPSIDLDWSLPIVKETTVSEVAEAAVKIPSGKLMYKTSSNLPTIDEEINFKVKKPGIKTSTDKNVDIGLPQSKSDTTKKNLAKLPEVSMVVKENKKKRTLVPPKVVTYQVNYDIPEKNNAAAVDEKEPKITVGKGFIPDHGVINADKLHVEKDLKSLRQNVDAEPKSVTFVVQYELPINKVSGHKRGKDTKAAITDTSELQKQKPSCLIKNVDKVGDININPDLDVDQELRIDTIVVVTPPTDLEMPNDDTRSIFENVPILQPVLEALIEADESKLNDDDDDQVLVIDSTIEIVPSSGGKIPRVDSTAVYENIPKLQPVLEALIIADDSEIKINETPQTEAFDDDGKTMTFIVEYEMPLRRPVSKKSVKKGDKSLVKGKAVVNKSASEGQRQKEFKSSPFVTVKIPSLSIEEGKITTKADDLSQSVTYVVNYQVPSIAEDSKSKIEVDTHHEIERGSPNQTLQESTKSRKDGKVRPQLKLEMPPIVEPKSSTIKSVKEPRTKKEPQQATYTVTYDIVTKALRHQKSGMIKDSKLSSEIDKSSITFTSDGNTPVATLTEKETGKLDIERPSIAPTPGRNVPITISSEPSPNVKSDILFEAAAVTITYIVNHEEIIVTHKQKPKMAKSKSKQLKSKIQNDDIIVEQASTVPEISLTTGGYKLESGAVHDFYQLIDADMPISVSEFTVEPADIKLDAKKLEGKPQSITYVVNYKEPIIKESDEKLDVSKSKVMKLDKKLSEVSGKEKLDEQILTIVKSTTPISIADVPKIQFGAVQDFYQWADVEIPKDTKEITVKSIDVSSKVKTADVGKVKIEPQSITYVVKYEQTNMNEDSDKPVITSKLKGKKNDKKVLKVNTKEKVNEPLSKVDRASSPTSIAEIIKFQCGAFRDFYHCTDAEIASDINDITITPVEITSNKKTTDVNEMKLDHKTITYVVNYKQPTIKKSDKSPRNLPKLQMKKQLRNQPKINEKKLVEENQFKVEKSITHFPIADFTKFQHGAFHDFYHCADAEISNDIYDITMKPIEISSKEKAAAVNAMKMDPKTITYIVNYKQPSIKEFDKPRNIPKLNIKNQQKNLPKINKKISMDENLPKVDKSIAHTSITDFTKFKRGAFHDFYHCADAEIPNDIYDVTIKPIEISSKGKSADAKATKMNPNTITYIVNSKEPIIKESGKSMSLSKLKMKQRNKNLPKVNAKEMLDENLSKVEISNTEILIPDATKFQCGAFHDFYHCSDAQISNCVNDDKLKSIEVNTMTKTADVKEMKPKPKIITYVVNYKKPVNNKPDKPKNLPKSKVLQKDKNMSKVNVKKSMDKNILKVEKPITHKLTADGPRFQCGAFHDFYHCADAEIPNAIYDVTMKPIEISSKVNAAAVKEMRIEPQSITYIVNYKQPTIKTTDKQIELPKLRKEKPDRKLLKADVKKKLDENLIKVDKSSGSISSADITKFQYGAFQDFYHCSDAELPRCVFDIAITPVEISSKQKASDVKEVKMDPKSITYVVEYKQPNIKQSDKQQNVSEVSMKKPGRNLARSDTIEKLARTLPKFDKSSPRIATSEEAKFQFGAVHDFYQYVEVEAPHIDIAFKDMIAYKRMNEPVKSDEMSSKVKTAGVNEIKIDPESITYVVNYKEPIIKESDKYTNLSKFKTEKLDKNLPKDKAKEKMNESLAPVDKSSAHISTADVIKLQCGAFHDFYQCAFAETPKDIYDATIKPIEISSKIKAADVKEMNANLQSITYVVNYKQLIIKEADKQIDRPKPKMKISDDIQPKVDIACPHISISDVRKLQSGAVHDFYQSTQAELPKMKILDEIQPKVDIPCPHISISKVGKFQSGAVHDFYQRTEAELPLKLAPEKPMVDIQVLENTGHLTPEPPIERTVEVLKVLVPLMLSGAIYPSPLAVVKPTKVTYIVDQTSQLPSKSKSSAKGSKMAIPLEPVQHSTAALKDPKLKINLAQKPVVSIQDPIHMPSVKSPEFDGKVILEQAHVDVLPSGITIETEKPLDKDKDHDRVTYNADIIHATEHFVVPEEVVFSTSFSDSDPLIMLDDVEIITPREDIVRPQLLPLDSEELQSITVSVNGNNIFDKIKPVSEISTVSVNEPLCEIKICDIKANDIVPVGDIAEDINIVKDDNALHPVQQTLNVEPKVSVIQGTPIPSIYAAISPVIPQSKDNTKLPHPNPEIVKLLPGPPAINYYIVKCKEPAPNSANYDKSNRELVTDKKIGKSQESLQNSKEQLNDADRKENKSTENIDVTPLNIDSNVKPRKTELEICAPVIDTDLQQDVTELEPAAIQDLVRPDIVVDLVTPETIRDPVNVDAFSDTVKFDVMEDLIKPDIVQDPVKLDAIHDTAISDEVSSLRISTSEVTKFQFGAVHDFYQCIDVEAPNIDLSKPIKDVKRLSWKDDVEPVPVEKNVEVDKTTTIVATDDKLAKQIDTATTNVDEPKADVLSVGTVCVPKVDEPPCRTVEVLKVLVPLMQSGAIYPSPLAIVRPNKVTYIVDHTNQPTQPLAPTTYSVTSSKRVIPKNLNIWFRKPSVQLEEPMLKMTNSNQTQSALPTAKPKESVDACVLVPISQSDVAQSTYLAKSDTAPPPSPSVIVAIDIGTTYSGYAFRYTRDPEDSVQVMRQWEGGDPGAVDFKIPTTLLLTPDGQFHSFGFAARDFYNNLNPADAGKWMYFEKFMTVIHSRTDVTASTELAASNGLRQPVLVVLSHALRFFRHQALRQIIDQQAAPDKLSPADIRWVLTVPAVWTSQAIKLLRRAAYQSGLASPASPDQLLISLEPEASSISVRRERLQDLVPDYPAELPTLRSTRRSPTPKQRRSISPVDHRARRRSASPDQRSRRHSEPRTLGVAAAAVKIEHLRFPDKRSEDCALEDANVTVGHQVEAEGTRYLVVDCGGAAVDISLFESESRGTYKYVIGGVTAPYGSLNVDNEFEKLLKKVFGADLVESFQQTRPAGWIDLLIAFESRKRASDPYRRKPLNVMLPFSFIDFHRKFRNSTIERVVTLYADRSVQWSMQGALQLGPDIMEQLFNPALTGIISSVKDVLNDNKAAGVKYLFLVGGFSESLVLQAAVRKELGHLLKIFVPYDVCLTTLKGALIYGSDPSQRATFTSPLTYGVSVQNRFVRGIHPTSKLVERDARGWCSDVFDSLLVAGQEVVVGETITRRYTLLVGGAGGGGEAETPTKIELYSCQDKQVRYVTDVDVKKCGTICIRANQRLKDVTGGGAKSRDVTGGGVKDKRERVVELSMRIGTREITFSATDIEDGQCFRTTIITV